jgi:exonuclease SbcC
MLPLRLEIRNFIAYRAPDALLFDGIHLACLTGANGAGKSSLLDAITWALWGEARAKSDDELIHQGQSDMQVSLKFEQDGAIYEVIRKRSRRARSSTDLELIAILPDGARSIRTEASTRQTQTLINDLLRLNYETFIRSAFLKQGGADAFTRLKPAERKDTLAAILGLERYEHYERDAKTLADAHAKAISVNESLIAGCDTELRKEPSIRAALEQAQKAQAEAAAAYQAAEGRLAEVQSAPAELNAREAAKVVLDARLKEYTRDLEAVGRDIGRAATRVNAAETLVAQTDAITAGYRALQTAIADEKALADKSQQLSAINAEIAAAESAIKDARAELDAQIRAGEAQIAALAQDTDALDATELDRVRAEAAAADAAAQERESLNAALKPLEEERATLTTRNDTLKAERDKLRTRLQKLNRIKEGACPECGRPLTPEHRDEMQRTITAEGVGLKTTMEANDARLQTIQTEIAALSIAFERATATVRANSRARERAAALETEIARAERARTEIASVQATLTVVRDLIAREDYAHAARERLIHARAQRDEIGYDDQRYRAARRDLDAYRSFAEQNMLLERAAADLPIFQAELGDARARQTAIEDKQRAAIDERAALNAEIAALQVRVQEYHARKEEADRQRRREREAGDKVVIIEQELVALDAQRERKRDYQARLAAARDAKAVYDELKLAFGKKGIPAMIIETAIPELEAAANELLGRMTNGRMNLKLETQREKKSSDGVIETLDIQIADELGTRAYELYSGGEAFRIDFALRVALSKLLARRAGAPLHTLFVDEGFGTQDDDGREKLVEAITAIQDDFRLILVITHIEELRDSFEVQIHISKTGDGSRIAVR